MPSAMSSPARRIGAMTSFLPAIFGTRATAIGV